MTDECTAKAAKQRITVNAEAFSLDAFCEDYGVGKTYAYEQIRDGRLKARKAGKRTLILKTDAQAWAASLPLMAGAA